MEVRRVQAQDDFLAIGDIYAQSWKAAYRGLVPQAYLDELTGERWAQVLGGSQYESFVLVDGEAYVGTACIAPARDEAMQGWGELISIYLLPAYFGKGFADGLLAYVLDVLKRQGFTDVYLWVLDGNARAQRFYARHGFISSGDSMEVTIAGKALTEVRYVRRAVGE